MGIFRVKKDVNYSVIHNTPLRDETLSWRAKGLLAYMLSLPDDWTFHATELSNHAKDSEKITTSTLKELKAAGYLRRYPVQNPETGKISHWETAVYEVPTIEQKNHLVEKPPSGKTTDWETTEWKTTRMENHSVEKGELLNTNILLSTKELNTDLQNTNHNNHVTEDESSKKLIDEQFKISYNFLMKHGIPLSEIAITELGEFCNKLGSELIIEAVNRAIDENAPKWRYIRSILVNWEKKKVKTINDVATLDSQFEVSKQKKNRIGTGYGKRKEIVPKWIKQQEETPSSQQTESSSDLEEQRKRLEEELKKYKRED